MRLTNFKPFLYLLSIASIFFFIASCSSDSSSPTSATSTVATAPTAAATAAEPAPAPDVPPTETTSDPFSCQQVGEVKFRFSDPGYITGSAVGGFVLLEGLPAGNKVIKLTWDNGANGDKFNTHHIGEVESYQNVFEHEYASTGIYEVKLEVSIKGTAGSCVRVREVTAGGAMGNQIVNGTFENGFSGWSTSSNGGDTDPMGVGPECDQEWTVAATGSTCNIQWIEGASTAARVNAASGSSSAWTSIDGDGPQTFSLSQTFVVPEGLTKATLSWKSVLNYSNVSDTRTNKVKLGGNVVHTDTVTGTDVGEWTDYSYNVTEILKDNEGKSMTLQWLQNIPGDYTGPAGYGLDNVQLIVE